MRQHRNAEDSPEYDASDPDRLYWDERVQRGLALLAQGERIQWELASLAVEVETTYGSRDMSKFAEAIGVDASTIRHYVAVIRAFPQFVGRPTNLAFTIFDILHARSDRMKWVDRAIRLKWSKRDLQRELARLPDERTSRRATPKDDTPAPKRSYSAMLGVPRMINGRKQELDWLGRQFDEGDPKPSTQPCSCTTDATRSSSGQPSSIASRRRSQRDQALTRSPTRTMA